MPRMFMSVLASHRVVALRRDGGPARLLPARRASGQPGKRRKEDEVLNGQNRSADHTGDAAGDPQIGFPEAGQACAPEADAMALGRYARELRERVVHVEHLVM